MKNIFYIICVSSCWLLIENSLAQQKINQFSQFPYYYIKNYYTIEQLKRAVLLLHKIPDSIIEKLPFSIQMPTKNPEVVACIEQIKNKKNLKQVFRLWNKISQYQIIVNDLLLKDYSTLICKLLYYSKQITVQSLNKKNSALQAISSVTQKIDRLPLVEILNTIDMLTNELPDFLEKYEFNSSITWKVWLKKYWWVPPVVTVWFGLRILVKFQNRPNYFALGYYPQPIVTNDPALLEIIRKNQFR